MSQQSDFRDVQRMAADNCSIAGSLEALGDTWSILVLRELFFGVRRFNEMQTDLGISRSVLTDRLNRLVDLGVVRPMPYQDPGERVRNEYRLTRKGVGLLPVMIALREWGDEHLVDGEPPVTLNDRETGEEIRLEMRTPSGKLVQPNEMVPRANPRARRVRPTLQSRATPQPQTTQQTQRATRTPRATSA